MRIAILDDRPAFSDYVGEMLTTWGLPLFDIIKPGDVARLSPSTTPVLILPAGIEARAIGKDAVAFAQRGGAVITFNPGGELMQAAGLAPWAPQSAQAAASAAHQHEAPDRPGPLRLRIALRPATGMAGELLPVVGSTRIYAAAQGTDIIAYLTVPQQWDGESAGITERAVGSGRIVAFAFDLPRSVWLLRQGDPRNVDWIPPGDLCARSSHLASDVGPRDAGWIPFADLLARILVDLVAAELPAPVPMLWHLPGEVPSLLLYSGDEDGAKLEWNATQFANVRKLGGRMNLYIIPQPGQTKSSREHVAQYRATHDVGPHPNLRGLDRRPIPERLAEYDKQLRYFIDTFGFTPRSVRNHCLTWVGFTDLAEVQQRNGIRMDANALSGGTYLRQRDNMPYSAFGAAMPMRFMRPDGSMMKVYQQHFHFEDDVHFGPHIDYSTKLSPAQWEVLCARCMDDTISRFHMPLGANWHPSNYASFAPEQADMSQRLATARGMPTWSYDQWLSFNEARDTWRFEDVTWDGKTLTLRADGSAAHPLLRLLLPAAYAGKALREVHVGSQRIEAARVVRYGRNVALAPLGQTGPVTVRAEYGEA